MNKTLSIGLAGFSFIIEEHAYIKLSEYLSALRSSLDTAEADEVMHDIEIRMVEIFKETLGKREVINDADVERMIAQIGKPEQIEEQEEAYYSSKSNASKRTSGNSTEQKQLFRDPERQKIAGVCAGLAYYLGLSITAMRAIWVGLFLLLFPIPGSPMLMVLLYIILWLVLPKAQTAADFLRMKGKPMNFDNLKNESSKLVQFANESTQRVGEIYNYNKPYINTAGNSLWNAFRYLSGGILALIGIALLLGSFAVFGIGTMDTPNVHFFDNLGFYLQDSNLGFLAIAVGFLTLFIPALIFCYLAIKLLSPKTKLKNTGYLIGALCLIWVAAVGATGFTALKFKSQYSGHNEETENIAINTASDSLLVGIKKVAIPQNFKPYWNGVFSDGKKIFKEDYPDIEVKRQDVSAPYLVISKSADGYNLPLQLQVPVEIVDNKIFFPNYVSYSYPNRLRGYSVNYQLVVPKAIRVVPMDEGRGYSLRDGDDDNSANVSMNIGGNKIVVQEGDSDSVIVNGKQYGKEQGKKMMDSIKPSLKELKNINIQVKNGKKEISINAK